MTTRVCVDCSKEKDASDFFNVVKGKALSGRRCKECRYASHNRWYKKVRNKTPERIRAYRDKTLGKTKSMVYAHYGKICTCCKRSGRIVLDHVNNDGSEHRKIIGPSTDALMVWIKRNDYPSTIQPLCYSCNTVKSKIFRSPKKFLLPSCVEATGTYWTVVNTERERLLKPAKDKSAAEFRLQQIIFFKNNPDKLGKLVDFG